MAGHSHWANIAHKKAAVDRRRARLFGKIARKIIAAVKNGGPDTAVNLRLKSAIQAGRAANMSNDQIDRAIKRATGAAAEGNYEELTYEGYTPGGAAVLLECLTDNRNRTGGDVRSIFTKRGGNLGTSGSVAWQFQRCAVVRVTTESTTEDDLMMAVLEAGADDIEELGEVFEVRGAPESLQAIQDAVAAADLTASFAEVSYVPKDFVGVDAATAKQVAALLEALDEHDDVQQVHCNVEFPDDFEP
jgi:YebC/PmpR family DNA-binding regulatory protein